MAVSASFYWLSLDYSLLFTPFLFSLGTTKVAKTWFKKRTRVIIWVRVNIYDLTFSGI